MQNGTQRTLVYTSCLLYFILAVIWHFSTDAPWDDDCVTRFFNAQDALKEPVHFVKLWNRPLFMILFVIPFQISKHTILLMAVFSAIGAILLYEAARKMDFRYPWLVVPLMLFQSYFFPISYNALAEPLAAILICFGFYFLSRKNYLAFTIAGSLLPLARLELSILLVIWAAELIRAKQYKYLPLFAAPMVLWSLAGSLLDGGTFWLYDQTIGKENSSNRYGHKEFSHYFKRWVFIVGPVVFYTMFVGLAERLFKLKVTLFNHGQFVLGFLLYVIFSWKLNLGQAAGFARHLIVLAPFASLMAARGTEAWLSMYFGRQEEADPAIPEETVDDALLVKKRLLDARIAELNQQAEDGTLKKRQLRHAIHAAEKEIMGSVKPTRSETKFKPKKATDLTGIAVMVGSLFALGAVYFYSAFTFIGHHKLSEEVNYTNVYVMLGLFALFGLLWFLREPLKKLKWVPIGVTLLVALACASFTLITEGPDAHNSPERMAMGRLSRVIANSDLMHHPIYVNHGWFYWASGLPRDTISFGGVTKDNLNKAPDSSLFIWENHYSHRLMGDVTQGTMTTDKRFIPLLTERSSDNRFIAFVYQKLPNATEEEKTALYDKLEQRFPEEASILLNRANLKFNKKKFGEALHYYQRVLRVDPLNLDALQNTAMTYVSIGDNTKALEFAQKAIDQEPKLSGAHYKLGLVHANMQQWQKAIEAFSEAIRLNKKYNAAYENRALAYIRQKNWAKAIGDYNSLLQMNPSNKGQIFYNRATTLMQQNRKELACKDLQQAFANGYGPAQQLLEAQCQN